MSMFVEYLGGGKGRFSTGGIYVALDDLGSAGAVSRESFHVRDPDGGRFKFAFDDEAFKVHERAWICCTSIDLPEFLVGEVCVAEDASVNQKTLEVEMFKITGAGFFQARSFSIIDTTCLSAGSYLMDSHGLWQMVTSIDLEPGIVEVDQIGTISLSDVILPIDESGEITTMPFLRCDANVKGITRGKDYALVRGNPRKDTHVSVIADNGMRQTFDMSAFILSDKR